MHKCLYWFLSWICHAWFQFLNKCILCEVLLVLPHDYLLSVSICLTLTSHYHIIALLLSIISSLVPCCPSVLPFCPAALSSSPLLIICPHLPSALHLMCLHFPLFSLCLYCSAFLAFSFTPQIHHA